MLIAFAAGMFVLAATPGPGVFGAVSKALSGGFAAALIFIAGLVLGDTIFFLLALAGMSALSQAMGNLFFLIRITGGIYLVYLGIKMFRSGSFSDNTGRHADESIIKTFTGGFLLTLGNPKPILFYASVLPAIIDLKDVHFIDAVLMIAIIIFTSFIVVGFYSYIASLSGKFFSKASAQKKVSRTAGLIMCATGTYICFKK
jgi:threonine/homoserine/homoserine lactone efflux protein